MMCEYCERIDGRESKHNLLTPELVACAQVIETDLPGERAPADAWAILSGAATGSIQWTHFERMMKSLDAAASRLPINQGT